MNELSKDDIIHTLNMFLTSDMLTKKVRDFLKLSCKKIKSFDDVSVTQLLDILSSYFEIDNMMGALDSLNNSEPYTHEYINSNNTNSNESPIYNPKISWIKRPTLMMYITDKSIIVNNALSEYMKDLNEIINENKKRDSYYDPDDAIYKDDSIRLLLGTVNDNTRNRISIGMITGQSEFNNFVFTENSNGCLEITRDSFKYFSEITKNSLEGIYVCNIDKKLNALIGDKIETTIES